MGFEYRVWFAAEADLNVFPLVGRGVIPTNVEKRMDIYLVTSNPKVGIKLRDFDFEASQWLLEIKVLVKTHESGVQQWKKVFKDYIPVPKDGWKDESFVALLAQNKVPTSFIPVSIYKERRQLETMGCVVEQTKCKFSLLGGEATTRIYQSISIEDVHSISSHLQEYFKGKSPVSTGSYSEFLLTILKEWGQAPKVPEEIKVPEKSQVLTKSQTSVKSQPAPEPPRFPKEHPKIPPAPVPSRASLPRKDTWAARTARVTPPVPKKA